MTKQHPTLTLSRYEQLNSWDPLMTDGHSSREGVLYNSHGSIQTALVANGIRETATWWFLDKYSYLSVLAQDHGRAEVRPYGVRMLYPRCKHSVKDSIMAAHAHLIRTSS